MLFHNLLMLLASSICIVGLLACFFIIAAVKPAKVSAANFPFILEITVAIYKYTILIKIASAAMACSVSLSNILAYKNISLEIIYFTSIMILIIFQISKKPEYPIANHS